MSFTASHFHTCNWNSLRHNYWSVEEEDNTMCTTDFNKVVRFNAGWVNERT